LIATIHLCRLVTARQDMERFLFVGSGEVGQLVVADSPTYGQVVPPEQKRGIVTLRVGHHGQSIESTGMLELGFHVGWLAQHSHNGCMYGVGSDHRAHAFTIAEDGSLALFSSTSTLGKSHFLELTPDGRWALVANYYCQILAVLPINADGTLGDASDSKLHRVEHKPELSDRQEACHPHQVRIDPKTGRWALACDLGADCVWIYEFDSFKGSLIGALNSKRHFFLRKGAGPRHMDFHSLGNWAYILCELDGNIMVCDWDPGVGQLKEKQSIYALPDGVACSRAPHSGLSQILVGENGRNVYVGSRTNNHIVVFKVDIGTGHLQKIQSVTSGGICPRNFIIDSSSGFPCLHVGNQDSQNIVSFAIDPTTGILLEPPQVLELNGICPQVVTPTMAPGKTVLKRPGKVF